MTLLFFLDTRHLNLWCLKKLPQRRNGHVLQTPGLDLNTYTSKLWETLFLKGEYALGNKIAILCQQQIHTRIQICGSAESYMHADVGPSKNGVVKETHLLAFILGTNRLWPRQIHMLKLYPHNMMVFGS